MNTQPYIIAISGVKNSGKTTLIEKMIPIFSKKNIRVGVLKHDGHSFSADVPGTDSYRFTQAGSKVSAVFDNEKYMLISSGKTEAEQILAQFEDVDIILLEGFKNSIYDKLEIVRKGNSEQNVCTGESLKGIVTDFEPELSVQVPCFSLGAPESVVDFILNLRDQRRSKYHATLKLMLHGNYYFFGPGCYQLLHKIGELGSIRKASMEMNLSYSKACRMINRVEEETGIQFLLRSSGGKQGGSSSLTEEAVHFLHAYEQYTVEMNYYAEQVFNKYFHEF